MITVTKRCLLFSKNPCLFFIIVNALTITAIKVVASRLYFASLVSLVNVYQMDRKKAYPIKKDDPNIYSGCQGFSLVELYIFLKINLPTK